MYRSKVFITVHPGNQDIHTDRSELRSQQAAIDTAEGVEMKLRGFAVLVLAVSAHSLFGAVASGPVVNSGTINYQSNQVTLLGSGFEPTKVAPAVVFSNTTLSVVSASNNQIVAKLPGSVAAGTFSVTVTANGGASTVFDITYGSEGPQGLAGPAGPQGLKGSNGIAGPTGPAGPSGPTGPTGPTGPQGPKGSAMAYSANGALGTTLPVGEWGRISVVTLKNPGTYILTGQLLVDNQQSKSASVACTVLDALGDSQQTAPWSLAQIGSNGYVTLPTNGIWVAAQANTSIWLECQSDGNSTNLQTDGTGSFSAIQVQ
jgi:hypothetical protein